MLCGCPSLTSAHAVKVSQAWRANEWLPFGARQTIIGLLKDDGGILKGRRLGIVQARPTNILLHPALYL